MSDLPSDVDTDTPLLAVDAPGPTRGNAFSFPKPSDSNRFSSSESQHVPPNVQPIGGADSRLHSLSDRNLPVTNPTDDSELPLYLRTRLSSSYRPISEGENNSLESSLGSVFEGQSYSHQQNNTSLESLLQSPNPEEVHATSNGYDIGPVHNPYLEFRSERKRLETFHNWPVNAAVSARDLAKNGFLYTGIGDRAQCAFCHNVISGWTPQDNVATEHRKLSPDCAFALGVHNMGNIPIEEPSRSVNLSPFQVTGEYFKQQIQNATRTHSGNYGNFSSNVAQAAHLNPPDARGLSGSYGNFSSNVAQAAHLNPADARGQIGLTSSNALQHRQAKYQDWNLESTRLASYKSWPSQLNQKPQALAKAGLFYLGQGDRVKCFWCGGELYDWDPQDDPWEEHAKWFPECGYVNWIMGEDYVKYIQDVLRGIIPDPFASPHVLAVLKDTNYSKEQIQHVKEKYGMAALINASNLIKALELEFGRTNNSHHSSMEYEETVRKTPLSEQIQNFSPAASDRNGGHDVTGLFKSTISSDDHQSGASNYQGQITLHKRKPDNDTKSSDGETKKKSKDNNKDVDTILQENQSLKDQRLCKICLDEEICVTFVPCGHFACCVACAVPLKDCPICRKPIQESIKTFWS
ncbi:hypothetical protein ACJMK2_027798 [Sinanodonta woodiana]|uniref:RING-type domain-containing protein n=1 Tax=Sinanodonta woodiana TaxID=1069815 RepID=A0ABD3X8L2_SINWO